MEAKKDLTDALMTRFSIWTDWNRIQTMIRWRYTSWPFSVNGIALTGPQYVLFTCAVVAEANRAIRDGNN